MTTRPATGQLAINRAARELLEILARRDPEDPGADATQEAATHLELALDEADGDAPLRRVNAPKYPAAKVRLVGADGNAFAILGRTKRALQGAGASPEEIAAFFAEATAGDYDELLGTVLRWVEVA